MAKNIYTKHYNPTSTPPSQPIPDSNQVQNNAGGYVWAVDDWTRLKRFLILGSEGGNYYTDERKLTVENAEAVKRCILADGQRVVNCVVEISDQGRAAKNDPALFVLAICAAAPDEKTRQAALSALDKVARTGTHLFTFLEMVQSFRGWGRALSRAVANWYDNKTVDSVAYQAVKYRQRNGWTHRDALRLAHPKADTAVRNALYNWMVKGAEADATPEIKIVDGFLKIQAAKTAKEAAELVAEYNLPREAIPTEFLKDVKVWEAMLPTMPLTAMIRNLGVMSSVGLLTVANLNHVQFVVSKLTDTDYLHKSRVHPIAMLAALMTYSQGHGVRGSNTWTPVAQIKDGLATAFHAAFKNIESTGKRYMLGLDVSGSMSWGEVSGVPGLTPAMASAAMAMVTARTEQNYIVQAFADQLKNLPITAGMSLTEVLRMTSNISFGGTDCSLPIKYARQHKIPVDVFVTYTDNETWAGERHAAQELVAYRNLMGIPAKLAVVAMQANASSIADPKDEGMINFIGFDTSTPQALAEFAKM